MKPLNRKEFLRNLRKNGEKIKPYVLMSQRQKYLSNGIRKIGYLDIESSGLTANFDIMLSYAILVRDITTGKTEIRKAVINRSDVELSMRKRNADLIDARILRKLMVDLSDLDCLIGHWFIGKHRHDIPFIRTRCAINKIQHFPKHRMVRYGDTQKWGSTIHRLSSNSLATTADAYGISTKKTPVKSKDWKLACFGDKNALDYVLAHNIKDVIITYKVHKHIEKYVPIPAIYY